MDDGEPMPVRLERFLAAVEPDRTAKVVGCKPISGGYSRVTTAVEVLWSDGAQEKLIVRADPPAGREGVFTSDRDREWQLLQALWKDGTVTIPRPRWYDATGEHLGTKTIGVDHVGGSPLQLALGPGADFRAAIDVYLGVAAALQRVSLQELPAVVEHPPDWDSAIDAAIDIYERAERALSESRPAIRYVGAWLRAHQPPPVALTLVHGDLQPGNILVEEGREPMVIDWEFTRIGDPREDVGYYSDNPLPHNLYAADRDYFLSRYRDLTGFTEEEMNAGVMHYFFVLGMADLFAQMMRAADALAVGNGTGVMPLFLINSLSYFHRKFIDICRP
jgi:aminoglycoside phosphotransferase (APT) family kinase protein